MTRLILAFALLSPYSPAWAQIAIDNPWTRATPPGARVAAGYMVIRNASGQPDRLVSAVSGAAARIEMHVHEMRDGVARMREVKGYEIPAKGGFELKPGGAHLMLVDVRRAFRQGDKVPATLEFARAGKVKVEFDVLGIGATGYPAGGHRH